MQPDDLGAEPGLDLLSRQLLHHTLSQQIRVEGDLPDPIHAFDHIGVEQIADGGRCRFEWRSDPAAEKLELRRGHVRHATRHRVVAVEGAVDAVVVLVDESREIDTRPDTGQKAPGVVIAVVHTRLVRVGGTLEQLGAHLDHHDPGAGSPKPQRQTGAIESTADDDRVVCRSHSTREPAAK